MSKTEIIQRRLGISKGQTFVSLSLAGLMVVISLSAATWVWSIDKKRGDQVTDIDKRVVTLEAHDADTRRMMERMDKKLDEIYKHLLND